jgi:hypothetical protein
VHEDRLKKKVDSIEKENSYPFASEILCAWEFSYSTKDTIQDYSASLCHVYNQLLDDAFARGKKSKRTRRDEYMLVCRRVAGYYAYCIIQMSAVMIIICLNVYSDLVQKYFGVYSSITVSVLLSAINIITPSLLNLITKFENWDYPETEINMLLIRMYFSASLNLVFIVFGYMLLANPVLISSYTYLKDLQIAYQPESYSCRMDQVSNGIFILVVSNFLIHLLTVFLKGYANSNLQRLIPSYQPKKREFKLANSLVGLLDLVGKAFLLFPFNPLSIILLPIFLYIQIKWEGFVMLRYYSKPKRPWRSQKARQVFAYIYLATIMVIAIPVTIAFLSFKTLPKSCDIQDDNIDLCLNDVTLKNGNYVCDVNPSSKYYDDFGRGSGSDAYPNILCSTACGAFMDYSTPFTPWKVSVLSVDALKVIFDGLFEFPYVPWMLTILLFVYLATKINTIQVEIEAHQSIEKVLGTKIITLEAENLKQSKIITRLRAADGKE